MLLFRTLAIVFFLITATSCGFQPMYASNSVLNKKSSAEIPDIYIGNIPDKQGQFLRNLLIDKYYSEGRPTSYDYELEFSPISKKTIEMGIQKDATATRIMVELSVQMKLIKKTDAEKKAVLEREVKSVGAHNLLTNQYTSLISSEDIIEDLLKEMSEDIVTEINLYFYNQQD